MDSSALDALKSAQLAKLAETSPADNMLDYLHETAYQGSALGNFVGGTKDTVPAVTGGDIAGLVGGVSGADVCVVGTGAGSHEQLCEAAEKAYGGLKAGSSEVGTVGGASQFIGSDVRYVPCCFLIISRGETQNTRTRKINRSLCDCTLSHLLK